MIPEDALIRLNQTSVAARLIGGVVHDLNNALLVIGGSIELLEDGPLDEGARPRLERIKRQQLGMAESLRELTAVLKSDDTAGRAEVAEAVRWASDLRLSSLRRMGGHVDIDVKAAGPVRVPMAIDRLLQVARNLLINAEDAVAPAQSRHVTWTIDAEGDVAILGISDTGWGIAASVQDRLFEPFVTSEPADGPQGLQAVHQRHLVVEDEQGMGRGGQPLEYVEAVVDLADLAGEVPQQYPAHHGARGRLVVSNQDPHALCESAGQGAA